MINIYRFKDNSFVVITTSELAQGDEAFATHYLQKYLSKRAVTRVMLALESDQDVDGVSAVHISLD